MYDVAWVMGNLNVIPFSWIQDYNKPNLLNLLKWIDPGMLQMNSPTHFVLKEWK